MTQETDKQAVEVVAALELEINEAMKEIGNVAEQAGRTYSVLKGQAKTLDEVVDIVAVVMLKRAHMKLPWYAPMPLVKMALKAVLHSIVKEKAAKTLPAGVDTSCAPEAK